MNPNFHTNAGLCKLSFEQHFPARDSKPLLKNLHPPESKSAFWGEFVILALKMKTNKHPSSKSRRSFVFVIKWSLKTFYL